MVSSMQYLYLDSEVWSGLRNFIWRGSPTTTELKSRGSLIAFSFCPTRRQRLTIRQVSTIRHISSRDDIPFHRMLVAVVQRHSAGI